MGALLPLPLPLLPPLLPLLPPLQVVALPQPADICPAAQAARRARGRQRRAAIWRAAEGRGRGRCLD